MEFYTYHPSDKYSLLKLYSHEMLSIFDSTDVMCRDTLKDEIVTFYECYIAFY